MDPLLENLNPAQQQAVLHVDGPLLVLAGPGSGKTRVVTHRIAHLLRSGAAARQIVALTFTNKAADEMRSRLERLAPGQPVRISTFHRFCSYLLRHYGSHVGLTENFTIYDTSDSRRALMRTMEDMRLEGVHVTPERVASTISWAKNHLVGPDEFQPRPGIPADLIAAEVYPAYQARLLASSAVDFDDLLVHVACLLRDNPELRATLDDRYRYVLVDEYQDTNLAQYAIVRALSVDYSNLAATGDPDQSIYGWRGANLNNILEFENDFPNVKVVRLEQNYRSAGAILRVADRLIAFNRKRKQKSLFTDKAEGRPVRLAHYQNQDDEAAAIAAQIDAEVKAGRRRYRDFAIFYRINALSRTLESTLLEHGIPYQLVNGVEFFQRKEIKDVLAYLHLVNNPRDDVAFERIINTPARGIGKRTIEHLRGHAGRKGISLLDAARECGLIEPLPKRAATLVVRFVSMFDRLREAAAGPVRELIEEVLDESGYRAALSEDAFEEGSDRLANVEELLTVARKYDEENPQAGALEGFLEQAALVNDSDAWEGENDQVALMTIHAAKGLEFPCVFIVALEDGLLPHSRASNSDDELEEERRLLFVGITRAEEELQFSHVRRRLFRGEDRIAIPSSFLFELPREEMDQIQQEGSAPTLITLPPPRTFAAEPRPGLRAALDEAAQVSGIRIGTAAQLMGGGGESGPPLAPEEFSLDMKVVHPTYQLGRVVELSGSGSTRRGVVAFATVGRKTFILANSQLRSARA